VCVCVCVCVLLIVGADQRGRKTFVLCCTLSHTSLRSFSLSLSLSTVLRPNVPGPQLIPAFSTPVVFLSFCLSLCRHILLISSTFYVQLLRRQIPNAQKRQSSQQCRLGLLGPTGVKAVRRTLMKLTHSCHLPNVTSSIPRCSFSLSLTQVPKSSLPIYAVDMSHSYVSSFTSLSIPFCITPLQHKSAKME